MQAKKILIAIILSFTLSTFAFIATANAGAGTPINFKPSVPLPGITSDTVQPQYFEDGTALGRYIIDLYKFGFSIIGILATITMMYGGLLYIIAAGDSGKESEARKWITASLSGVTLMLSTCVILNYVNPDLVKMTNLDIDKISNEKKNSTGIKTTAEAATESIKSCEGNCTYCCLYKVVSGGNGAFVMNEEDYNSLDNSCDQVTGSVKKNSKPNSSGTDCISI